MRNKKTKSGGSYAALFAKLLLKALMWNAILWAALFLIYLVFLRGRLGNFLAWIVMLFSGFDSDNANALYEYLFIENRSALIFLVGAVVMMISFALALRGCVKYFRQINTALDSLLEENSEDVRLARELSASEEKINSIKHRLAYEKLAAESAEKRKNELVMYIAHDLKTPLTSVIGYLTLLRDENQISDELREKYLSVSLEKAERLEDLINEFFEITRFNIGEITLQYSRVNLTRALEQLVYEFKPMLAEKSLTITLDAPPDIMINCDSDKLQRVFDNILRNAVSYSFENSDISVLCTVEDNKASVAFTNAGNTIPQEKLERIFTQFYRLDTARGSSGGAGLGLAIAKQIAELHGGEITAQSEDDTVRFTVVLPLS